MDNKEGNGKKPTSDIKIIEYLLYQIESSQGLEPRTKKALNGVLHFVAKAESQIRRCKGFRYLALSTQNKLIRENAAGHSGHDQPV